MSLKKLCRVCPAVAGTDVHSVSIYLAFHCSPVSYSDNCHYADQTNAPKDQRTSIHFRTPSNLKTVSKHESCVTDEFLRKSNSMAPFRKPPIPYSHFHFHSQLTSAFDGTYSRSIRLSFSRRVFPQRSLLLLGVSEHPKTTSHHFV